MPHTTRFTVDTPERDAMVDITRRVQDAVSDADVSAGLVNIFIPHTTAGVTINENADPDVVRDMLAQLDRMVPWQQSFYRHAEGNSASHVKASMIGSSATVHVRGGKLQLGRWQGIYLCEFDGPRTREVWISADGIRRNDG